MSHQSMASISAGSLGLMVVRGPSLTAICPSSFLSQRMSECEAHSHTERECFRVFKVTCEIFTPVEAYECQPPIRPMSHILLLSLFLGNPGYNCVYKAHTHNYYSALWSYYKLLWVSSRCAVGDVALWWKRAYTTSGQLWLMGVFQSDWECWGQATFHCTHDPLTSHSNRITQHELFVLTTPLQVINHRLRGTLVSEQYFVVVVGTYKGLILYFSPRKWN